MSNAQLQKKIFVVLVGIVSAQGLFILASPLISRYYTPADFGVFAVYASLIGIISTVASFRYEIAIPLAQTDLDAFTISILSFVIICLTALLSVNILLVINAYPHLVSSVAGVTISNKYLWFIPFGIVACGLFTIINYNVIRWKNYRLIATAKLSQSATLVLTQVSLGLIGIGASGLIGGQIIGHIAGSVAILKQLKKKTFTLAKQISIKDVKFMAKRFMRFPIFSTWASLLDVVGQSLPSIVFALWYGTAVAGFYAFSERIITLPIIFAGQAIAQVYLGEAATLVRENPKNLLTLYLNTAGRLLMFGVLPVLFIFTSGPFFFRFVFGEAWVASGKYASILSPMLLIQFIVNPLSNTLNLLERQDLQSIWVVVWLSLIVVGLCVSRALNFEAAMTTGTIAFAMAIAYALHFFLSVSELRKRVSSSESWYGKVSLTQISN